MTTPPSPADQRHHAVVHPAALLATERRKVTVVNNWLATHLGAVFGAVWTIWVFFIAPLAIQLFPQHVQDKFFYYSSGWVQLFALPLFVYIGNRLQRTSDAQSEAAHQAQTHIALTVDQALVKLDALDTYIRGGAPGRAREEEMP